MAIQKKLSKLVGITFEEFESFVESGQIKLSKARLIPMLKMGDEMALTSIFLSTLRIVREFREQIFSDSKISKTGKAYYFTEISFPEIAEKNRIDGLLIIVSGGKIKDSAFFEMKNRNNTINSDQIENYLDIAKKLAVSKMITISNEFVADPSQIPYQIKGSKSIRLFHFSWTYILTISKLLLFKNEINIRDNDQIEIMKETVAYLENKDSGVSGFTQMKPSWKDVVEKIVSRVPIKHSDKAVEEAVVSWHQEEKDMALMLSRELGILVGTGSESKNTDIAKDCKRLVEKHSLSSILKIKGSVSSLEVVVQMDRKTIAMMVKVLPPLDKGLKARIGWIIKQIDLSQKKNPEAFKKIQTELWIEAQIKYSNSNVRIKYSELEKLYDIDKSKEVTEFKICMIKEVGRNFESVKKFIEIIESMLIDYYKGIVQNLTNWERPAPKIIENKEDH